ncbi:MAG TPA: fructosamine kinase family protein [Flavitalea sp.]|nr:fructosamine kinase family protein [Flavitalea sp.]
MITSVKEELRHLLGTILNTTIIFLDHQTLTGGSINSVYHLEVNKQEHFCCKINTADKFPSMFGIEKTGLEHLGTQKVIRVPKVIACEKLSDHQVLILEWIEPGSRLPVFWKKFGQQLSQLHEIRGTAYGLDHNNYMGAMKQSNIQSSSWSEFFYNERIIPQAKLAVDNQLLTLDQAKKFERLPSQLGNIFDDNRPSLVHGDLWSGNFLCDIEKQPVLIDPAIYYGHPAVDLGLTTLFGGFDKSFYEAYNYYSPFASNYMEQWDCCNLYPLLIHLNLFGRGYLGDILEIIGRY